MDRRDEEFETFLRQFRPQRPKALPNRRRGTVVLAAAAALLLAVAIPMWPRFIGETAGTSGADRVPASAIDPRSQPDRPTGTSAAPEFPTLSPAPRLRGARPPQAGTSAAASKRRLRVGEVIKPPFRIVNVNPVYPPEAQAAGIDGFVILEIVIGTDGSVVDVEVLRSIPELDQAAIDAVYQWHYEPTLLNGEPVEVEMAVRINFTLAQ